MASDWLSTVGFQLHFGGTTVARDYLTDFELMLLLATLRVGDDAYGCDDRA